MAERASNLTERFTDVNRSSKASWVRVMAGTAALSLALAACSSEDNSEPTATDPTSEAPSEEPTETTAPVAELTDDKCDPGVTSADQFKAGGILPITGNLAFLGPPEIAGVGLAVSQINAAGGVNGTSACYQIEDSGAADDLSVANNSADKLIQGKPSIVVGAASSSVSQAVVQTFTDAKVVQVSPANTAVALSGISPFYFRTAPPDTVQGNALGNLIASDGNTKVAFIVFNDTYGTGLRDVVEETIVSSGGNCSYGCKGDGDEFPVAQTTFSAEVSAATATNPDAIVILAFDETKSIVPELVNSGFDMSKVYLSDGNTADYSEDLPPGSLTGAQGTIPGADAAADFKDLVSQWAELGLGEALVDFAYSAESYDAVILGALAAAKGGSNDAATVKDNFAAVSGATDGTECGSFSECLDLLDAGDEIRYAGPSGIGPINDQNDPSSAFVGIYEFQEDNSIELTSTVEGSS